jgi:hemerythrin
MTEASDTDALVHQVQVQHKELHRMLDEIRSHCERLAVPQHTADGAAHLKEIVPRLRTFLQRHFQQEEQGGWLEEAAARIPRLSHSLTELEKQHRDLLGQTDQVIVQLEQPPHELIGAVSKLAALADALKAHEAREEEVLSQGFNEDLDVPT